MIQIVKGNKKYLKGTMNLLNKIRTKFKAENLDIYQNEEYPNEEIILNDLKKTDSTLVIVDDEEVIGFIASENENDYFNDIFENNNREAFIEKYKLKDYLGRFIGFSRLMIDPDYRHQGLASKLMTILNKKYSGYVIIFLCHKENSKAQKLYATLNYDCLGLENFSFGEYYVYTKNQLRN